MAPGPDRVQVIFAYGAGDRGDQHAIDLEARLKAWAGLDATVTPILWQAKNLSVSKEHADWIADERFPTEWAAKRWWSTSWKTGFQRMLAPKSRKLKVAVRPFRGLIRGSLAERYPTLTRKTLPVVMDVLAYVRRSKDFYPAVSDALRAFAASTSEPKVVVGLSLGGIMLVDVLARMTRDEGRPDIDLLVTAGSQAPYLYAVDSLPNIRVTDDQPSLFLPWLNIWNPNDFLSFPAEPAFGQFASSDDPRRVLKDAFGTNDALFPEVHSGYFGEDDTVPLRIRVALEDLGRVTPLPTSQVIRHTLANHDQMLSGNWDAAIQAARQRR